MPEPFKAYKYKKCMIYSPKNKMFLEGFTDALELMPQTEKNELKGRTVILGGIKYLVLLTDKGRVGLSSETNKTIGKISCWR